MKTELELRHEALRMQQRLIDDLDVDSKLTRVESHGLVGSSKLLIPRLTFGVMTLEVHSYAYFRDYEPTDAFEYALYHPSYGHRQTADENALVQWVSEALDAAPLVTARDEIDRPIW